MKAKFHMSTLWWCRKITESSCFKRKKQLMKENMVQIIKCNYYFSCAKKLSNSVILVLGDFIKLLITTIFCFCPHLSSTVQFAFL